MSTLNVMESCSKWARKITHTERIPEYVAMAYRHAMDTSPGPVYLEIPTDLLFAKVEEEKIFFPVESRTEAIPYGDPGLIDAARSSWSRPNGRPSLSATGPCFPLGTKPGPLLPSLIF